ncbi:DUF4157 domain-containing protein [Kitasatospora sp. MAP5-34]|uniref:eCIS core domain-containing protein n=1 Tax=Kitasatospora sp. MAP5-34 TaxID=3035102 RepID=UPI0024768CC2|nr:DUF4157 domain-containing protein [Kitasatospora sp. MAP5-34]MDH6577873.1 hypothetical protein [Kitasatospora sp. MAP5-34]
MHARERPDRPEDVADRPRAAAAHERPALGPELLGALQRSAGNTAVTRLVEAQRCADHGSPDAHPVQRATVHQVLRESGRPLATPVRSEMEARLGADFADVRVHDSATAQRSAAELGARAYTSGSHIVVGSGGGDRHTLAHELTHVIQQRQGPVAGTDNGGGVSVSDPSDRFERAAEANAVRVMRAPVSTDHSGRAESGIERGAEEISGTPLQSNGVQRNANVQRDTFLSKQQGPSCWLYVLEAIGTSYGLNLSSLSIAMRAYPSTADRAARYENLRAAGRAEGVDQRHLAVVMTAERLAAMVQELVDWDRSPARADRIHQDELRLMARRAIGSEASVDRLAFTAGWAGFASVLEAYREAAHRADMLANIIKDANDEEVSQLLNSAPGMVTAGQHLRDVCSALTNQTMPSYVGIRKRYKPVLRSLPDEVDLRSRPVRELQPTAHAILLDHFEHHGGPAPAIPGNKSTEHNRHMSDFVIYKDPNYGNVRFKVTLSQFRAMAGTGNMPLRPFILTSTTRSKLTELQG